MTEYRTASLPVGTWVPRIVDRHWLYATDPTGKLEPVCLAYLPWIDEITLAAGGGLYVLMPAGGVTTITVDNGWKRADLGQFCHFANLELARYRKRAA